MTDHISFSEFATLAQCETKWWYGYNERLEDKGDKKAAYKGTLLHLGANRWLAGLGATLPREWTDDHSGENMLLSDFDLDVVSDAEWLLARYEVSYGSEPPSSWTVISTEETLSMTLPSGTLVTGRTDGLIEIDGELWLREVKSYGDVHRLDRIHVEPQPTIYYSLVEEKYGKRPFGILYDGIYTYRWKRDEHHADDSFERRFIDRNAEALRVGTAYLDAAVGRRIDLIGGGIDAAMPNVSRDCSWCGFKAECWERLSGGEAGSGDLEFA